MNTAQEITIERLESGDVEPGNFDHRQHVKAAWLYLDRYPVTDAIARYSSALKRLTIKLGVPGKYHETITWFYMLVIAQRRAAMPAADWPGFRDANPDLFAREDNVLYRYYSRDALGSDDARESFVLPDRIAA